MTDVIRHNKKVNLLAFLSMCLFVVTGFVNILSWLLFMLPIVITFYVYDFKHGCIYQKSTEKCILDYAVYLICLVELICCITSIYKPNSISATLRILLLAVFYFFVRTFIRFRSQFDWLCIGISCLTGILSMITLLFFLVHRNKFYSVGFENLTDFRAYYRPLGQLSNDWATVLLCLLPFALTSIFIFIESRWKYCFLLIGSLNMIALLVSFSRGVYWAVFLFWSLLFLGTLLFKKNELKNILGVTIIIWLVSLIIVYPERKTVITTCAISKTVSQQRSIEGRFAKWKEAVNLFLLFPFTGVGGGNYALASDCYPQKRLGLFTTRSTNTYLQIATEKGIVGIVGYCSSLLTLIVLGIKNVLKKRILVTIFCFATLIALSVREITFSSLFEIDMLLVLSVILILLVVQSVIESNYELLEVSK